MECEAQHMDGFWSTSLNALRTPSVWICMENPLQKHGWLNHWPLGIDSTRSPLPSLEVRGGLENSNSLTMVGFPGKVSSIFRGFPKITLWPRLRCGCKGLVMINKTPVSPLWFWPHFGNWGQDTTYYSKRCFHFSYCLGDPIYEPRAGTKTKLCIYYKLQYHRGSLPCACTGKKENPIPRIGEKRRRGEDLYKRTY